MNPRKISMFLYLTAKIPPEAWDAIIPHGPKISKGSREYLIAMALKGFAAEFASKTVPTKLAGVQKTLVNFAGQQIAAGFDDDDWCGTPYPGKLKFRGPDPVPWFSFEDVMLNPQPLPPKELEREIGGYLLMLSEATRQEGAAKELKNLGAGLLGRTG